MGLRDTLNQNPRLTTGITAGLLIVMMVLIFASSRGGTPPAPSTGMAEKYFFSDDDGKTWFPDDATKVPPFQRNGKEAVRAYVYKCGGQTHVNHMERFTPEGRKKAEELYARNFMKTDPTAMESARQAGMEVKLPGQGAWVKASDPKAQDIVRPRCPGGGSLDDLEVVTP